MRSALQWRVELHLLLLLAGACIEPVPLPGRPCPCAAGYDCCPDGTCIPDGEVCRGDWDLDSNFIDRVTLIACSITHDDGLDGTVDDRTYQLSGRGWFRSFNDEGDDGRVEGSTRMAFDGPLLRSYEERDGQGSSLFMARWRYSAGGQLIGRVFDYEGDGQIDSLETIVYEHERPIGERHFDADGVLKRSAILLFDDYQRLVRRASDTDLDGAPDVDVKIFWSDRALEQQRTIELDGDPVFSIEYDHDEEGRETVQETWSWMYGFPLLERREHQYDHHGRRVTTDVVQEEADGQQRRSRLRYEYECGEMAHLPPGLADPSR